MKDTTSLMLRLPADVKDWVAEQAQRNERSQNSQIVWLLRQAMATKNVSIFYGDRAGNQANPAYFAPAKQGDKA